MALRTIHEILVSAPGAVIELVTFYGKVSSTDPAPGQPARRLLLQVSAERKAFETYALSELDPVEGLKRLNARSSPRPYDLVPVSPPWTSTPCFTRNVPPRARERRGRQERARLPGPRHVQLVRCPRARHEQMFRI